MDNILINNNVDQLNVELIHRVLSGTYWGQLRKLEEVKKSIEHSLNFGVYHSEKQIGFARVLTDYSLFAYIFDVFIVEEHQGKGYSKQLMKAIMEHKDLQEVKHWKLKTVDAHGLYEQFGFEVAKHPAYHMEYNTVPEDWC